MKFSLGDTSENATTTPQEGRKIMSHPKKSHDRHGGKAAQPINTPEPTQSSKAVRQRGDQSEEGSKLPGIPTRLAARELGLDERTISEQESEVGHLNHDGGVEVQDDETLDVDAADALLDQELEKERRPGGRARSSGKT